MAPLFVLALAIAMGPPRAAAVTVPAGFVVENAVPNTGFNMPTGFAFTPDGRILVAEKRGQVRVVQGAVKLTQPMWNGEIEVLNNGERGLLGIAVDPAFALNGYVYLLFTVDPDSNGVDDNDDAFGRLVRYRTDVANPNVLDPASRTVLLGGTWSDGFASGSLSHAVGALRWGADGSLLVSCGDGAHYSAVDSGGRDPAMFGSGRIDPAQNIGAYRAQSLSSPNGKILRIDPANGDGFPSNPFFDGNPRSIRSRIWATGLRNPFRFCLRPGTGDSAASSGNPGIVVAGDVGWMNEEEVDVIRPGDNLGWPCYEGMSGVAGYQAVRSVQPNCSDPAMMSRRAPAIAYHQVDTTRSTVRGVLGRCVTGGVFLAGGPYPQAYRDRYFFADFSAGWIKTAAFDADHELVDVVDFAAAAEGPVDFSVSPSSGQLHYLALYTGRLYRVRYEGPLAVGPASRSFGMSEAWPNPAPGRVSLTVEIDRETPVGLSVFDVQSRLVWTEAPRLRSAGRVPFVWSGSDERGQPAPAGIYFARASAGGMAITRKIVLTR